MILLLDGFYYNLIFRKDYRLKILCRMFWNIQAWKLNAPTASC